MSDAEVAALARFLPLIDGGSRGIFFGSAPAVPTLVEALKKRNYLRYEEVIDWGPSDLLRRVGCASRTRSWRLMVRSAHPTNRVLSSFPRTRESRGQWIPAFAGMTASVLSPGSSETDSGVQLTMVVPGIRCAPCGLRGGGHRALRAPILSFPRCAGAGTC